jgi:hypothetical protein
MLGRIHPCFGDVDAIFPAKTLTKSDFWSSAKIRGWWRRKKHHHIPFLEHSILGFP